MKILLTGFEPFNGSDINPSAQVAKASDGQVINGMRVVAGILPVENRRGPERLLEMVRGENPDAVVCLGEASGRAVVSVERLAVNLLDYRIADNGGNVVVDQAVVSGGPAAYFATLPVRKMYQAILAAAVPCELSLSAGTFLCNQVMYSVLHYAARQKPDLLAGFIHLPSLPVQVVARGIDGPSIALEMSLCAVRAAITVIQENH